MVHAHAYEGMNSGKKLCADERPAVPDAQRGQCVLAVLNVKTTGVSCNLPCIQQHACLGKCVQPASKIGMVHMG